MVDGIVMRKFSDKKTKLKPLKILNQIQLASNQGNYNILCITIRYIDSSIDYK